MWSLLASFWALNDPKETARVPQGGHYFAPIPPGGGLARYGLLLITNKPLTINHKPKTKTHKPKTTAHKPKITAQQQGIGKRIIKGAFGRLWGTLRVLFGDPCGAFGVPFGVPGRPLGDLWAHFGRPKGDHHT